MLDLLLSARGEDGVALTDRQVRDQVVTFLVAGHETVATALTWAWGLLAADGDRQDRLHAEAVAVLGDRAPARADVDRLPFARAVLDEAMRLYPPAWLITRSALTADDLAGRAVPAGALVIVSPWLVHRHPDWWRRPERFEPERFLAAGFDRTAFVPFGFGPRMCIGREFAYVEGVLVLACLARRFSFTFPPGRSMPPARALVTLRPAGGLPLRVAIRR